MDEPLPLRYTRGHLSTVAFHILYSKILQEGDSARCTVHNNSFAILKCHIISGHFYANHVIILRFIYGVNSHEYYAYYLLFSN